MFHLYGLIVGVGVVAVWTVSERLEPRVSRVLPWMLLGALLGARLYHVVDQWVYYRAHLWNILALWNGGLAIWGGVMGAVSALLVYHFVFDKSGRFWHVLGAICTALPLGQAIGRWGNAVNGEFTNSVFTVVPWWLAESVLDFGLFVFLLWRVRRTSRTATWGRGQVGLYLVGYGLIRGVLEWERRAPWTLYGIPTAVWVSGVGVVIGAFLSLYKYTP